MSARAKKGSLVGLACTVFGCSNPMHAKQVCKRHYGQVARKGVATPGTKGAHGSTEQRFWNFVEDRDPSKCWNWTGFRDKDGYGKIRVGKSNRGAHRVSYELHFGAIPVGLLVLHACSNPARVNPAHLRAGDHNENMIDRLRAGHYATNEAHPQCKFSDEVVQGVRTAAGTYEEVGRAFGMSASQVGSIRRWDQRLLQAAEREMSMPDLFDVIDEAA